MFKNKKQLDKLSKRVSFLVYENNRLALENAYLKKELEQRKQKDFQQEWAGNDSYGTD